MTERVHISIRGRLGELSLETTSHDLQRTAKQIAEIAVELNGVAHDLQGDPEALRLRALGVQAEARRLAMAALAACEAGAEIACAARLSPDHG